MLIASRNGDSVRLSIIGAITGESEWFASDAAQLAAILAEADGAPLDVWVSSPGGDLDTAFSMRAQFADYTGPVSIKTAGLIASAATLLLCVPNATVTAQRGSTFMVHQASIISAGNAEEMRKCADVLDVCDDEIVKVYQIRLKCDEDEIRSMLRAETWMRPEDAKEIGLVDEIASDGIAGFLAEPQNPDPLPDEPDRAEDIREAISACLAPRMDAIQTGLVNISANGETRVRAIQNAAESAVSDIVAASDKTVAGIVAVGEDVGKTLAEQLQALRDEITECRRSYNKQAEKYAALDEALSRVYALSGGDINFSTTHDEDRRVKPFKLNV